jgi:hypothetical protein
MPDNTIRGIEVDNITYYIDYNYLVNKPSIDTSVAQTDNLVTNRAVYNAINGLDNNLGQQEDSINNLIDRIEALEEVVIPSLRARIIALEEANGIEQESLQSSIDQDYLLLTGDTVSTSNDYLEIQSDDPSIISNDYLQV